MPLTNIEIKNAQPKDREYIMSDSGGLVILIKPSGAKLWRYRYSINAKKQKLSLGSYPEISLAQARIRAADARAKVAQGISPVTERREKKEASKVVNSFEGVYGEKLTGHGFRHMMSTILHEKGFNSAWIELQLAHADKNTIRGTLD